MERPRKRQSSSRVRGSAAIYGAEPNGPEFFREEMARHFPLRTRFQRDVGELESYFENYARRHGDATVMMFAVLGYFPGNSDVQAALDSARRHLRPGGLFFCDMWYGPAVLSQRPSERITAEVASWPGVTSPTVMSELASELCSAPAPSSERTTCAFFNVVAGVSPVGSATVGAGSTGEVGEVKVLKNLPMGLDDAAVEAVKLWRFRPAMRNGQPVDCYYTLTVTFRVQ